MKRFVSNLLSASIILAGLVAGTGARASYPQGYYDSLEGKCGADLMKAVKATVRNHTVISYGTQTWNAFLDTDVRMVNGQRCWWDMYSNNNVAASSSSNHPGMNIEHTVANSWWGGTKNDAYNDIVHLNPSNSDANSRKSNYPIAELATVTWDNGVTFIGKPKTGQGGGATYCYEPCDEYKGDFARVFMYMFTIYNDISWRMENGYGHMYDTSNPLMFREWAKQLLIRWSTNDPVSQKELDRNDGIYKHQKNRNPFIDLPELADHIWGAKSNVPFSLKGNDSGNNDDNGGDNNGDDNNGKEETQLVYNWLKETDASKGDWTIEDVTLPSASNYVWSWKTYNGLHYINGSAFINNTSYAAVSYIWSPEVSFDEIKGATLSFDHAAKFQTNLKSKCMFVVRDADTGEITTEEIPSWPAPGSWTFSNSGNIDLSRYAGKNIQVGFKYESTSSAADTWEIRNVTLTLSKESTAIELPREDDDNLELVEVWGNNILAPRGTRIFDMNGREFNGENLQPGLYIVVKPSFSKAVKVLVK